MTQTQTPATFHLYDEYPLNWAVFSELHEGCVQSRDAVRADQSKHLNYLVFNAPVARRRPSAKVARRAAAPSAPAKPDINPLLTNLLARVSAAAH